jgi:hypothetical protein
MEPQPNPKGEGSPLDANNIGISLFRKEPFSKAFSNINKEFSMKNTRKFIRLAVIAAIVFTVLFAFSTTACSKSSGGSSGSIGGGGKSINSATELKEYLDKQPANGPDKPIKVAMKANDAMLKSIAKVINDAGKYVSLDLSGSPLTTIPYEAFYDTDTYKGCETLVSIIIPNSVTSIEYGAFTNCTSLTRVNIPNSVTSLSGFTDCTNLASITIPNSVTSIGSDAFNYCTNLASVTIPDSVTSIGAGAFNNCDSLTSITIGSSVTSIGDYAFNNCDNLTSVIIPNSVTSIGYEAFAYCYSLTSVTFQGTINKFYYAFGDSSKINRNGYIGDLREKYLAGGIGTYTTTAPIDRNSTWTKQ